MTRPELLTTKGRRRRNQLLAAALKVIAAKGYAGTTQRAIAQEAGLPPTSTQYFFTSIDELAREAAATHLRQRAAAYEQLIEEFLAEERAPADGLKEAARVLAEVAVDMRVAQFEIYLNGPRHPELAETVVECLGRFENVGAQVLAAAGVPEPGRWAKAVLALGDGFALQRVAGAPAPPEAFEEALVAIVIAARMSPEERRHRDDVLTDPGPSPRRG